MAIWLVRYWQLLEGAFVPRSTKFGKYYDLVDFLNDKKIKKFLSRGKTKVICLNDGDNLSMENSEIEKRLVEILNTILPEKSSFEK